MFALHSTSIYCVYRNICVENLFSLILLLQHFQANCLNFENKQCYCKLSIIFAIDGSVLYFMRFFSLFYFSYLFVMPLVRTQHFIYGILYESHIEL